MIKNARGDGGTEFTHSGDGGTTFMETWGGYCGDGGTAI